MWLCSGSETAVMPHLADLKHSEEYALTNNYRERCLCVHSSSLGDKLAQFIVMQVNVHDHKSNEPSPQCFLHTVDLPPSLLRIRDTILCKFADNVIWHLLTGSLTAKSSSLGGDLAAPGQGLVWSRDGSGCFTRQSQEKKSCFFVCGSNRFFGWEVVNPFHKI